MLWKRRSLRGMGLVGQCVGATKSHAEWKVKNINKSKLHLKNIETKNTGTWLDESWPYPPCSDIETPRGKREDDGRHAACVKGRQVAWELPSVTVLCRTLALGLVFLAFSLHPISPQSTDDYFGKSPSCIEHIQPAPKGAPQINSNYSLSSYAEYVLKWAVSSFPHCPLGCASRSSS